MLRESKFGKSLAFSTTLVHGRIQVKMPWKEGGPPKRSNFEIALKRMFSAEKSFQKKACFKVVDEEVQKLLEQNFVTKVPPEQIDHGKPEWYLPLQAVFTPEKTTKVRLFFDSSSKGHDSLSLNDFLEKGPYFINSLVDVLAAWRWNEVAFTGDVRKKLNQILVHPDDQVYHRFLWRSNTSDSPTVYQWLRLNFGDKPAPDIATNAINTLARLSQAEFPEAAKEVQDHVYVDDIGGSRETTAKAKQITNDIDSILEKGHFQVKTWHSNQEKIDQSNGERFTDLLGLRWDKHTDKFTLRKKELSQLEVLTKRNCLGLIGQLWDPIGLVLPVAIKFRIDLQELWSSRCTYTPRSPTFFNTAIEMLGPLQIKLNRKTLKEAQVIIFACMTTRAVHLELVNNKTSDAFLMAFRRFASLRGHPSVCWSDYGTNFVGAQGYLREIMQNWNISKFKVFYLRISVVILNGNGIYLTQAIKMASWKLSSSL